MLSIEHNYSLYKHPKVYLIRCWEKKGSSYLGVADRLSIFCEVNNSYACWILETQLYWARSCECYYEEVEVELLVLIISNTKNLMLCIHLTKSYTFVNMVGIKYSLFVWKLIVIENNARFPHAEIENPRIHVVINLPIV